jgi:hypothetical protein
MLKKHFTGPACTYRFPGDVEAYLAMDDIHLHGYLRQANDPWARRITERRPYRRALELHGSVDEVARAQEARAMLDAAGFDTLYASSTGKLSRYSAMGRKRERAPVIYVVQRAPGVRERATPLQAATRIFDRYQDERHIARVYVPEDRVDEAQKLVMG